METNQVRQILMNELGLTRETVRNLATEIVQQAVDVHIKKLISDGHLQRMVDSSLNKVLATNHWDRDAFRRLIIEGAASGMKQHLQNNLKL